MNKKIHGKKKKVLSVIGTRPEAIKMAPVILELARKAQFSVCVLSTAQHRHILDQVLRIFKINPDIDLNIMRPSQTLCTLTARLLQNLDRVLEAEKPDVVLAQGDTTTVMTTALTCFYHSIPFGHVEAGLRTGNMQSPFPEEMNRIVVDKLACWHFAPTQTAKQNLLNDGVPEDSINVTGNTGIDALIYITKNGPKLRVPLDPTKRLILVTAHRRESFGEPLREICLAIRTLVDKNHDVQILYPVHPNPNVSLVAHDILDNHPRILLCPPLDYPQFVSAMQSACLILTDSGGVQEEAPALGKPVLVLRKETERPEAIEEGVAKLVCPEYDSIVRETQHLLNDEDAYRKMARGILPYGDGHAAERIVKAMENYLK